MLSRLSLALSFAVRQCRGDPIACLLAAVMLAIGAGTISFLFSLGRMAASEATRGLSELGPNLVSTQLAVLRSDAPRVPDVTVMAAAIGSALNTSPVVVLGLAYGMLRRSGRTESVPVVAVEGPLLDLLGLRLQQGYWLDGAPRSCVIGQQRAAGVVIGETLLMDDRPCLVVGVLAPVPRLGLAPTDLDRAILVTHDGAARLGVDARPMQILLRVPDGQPGAEFQALVRRYAAVAWPWAQASIRGTGEMIAALQAQYQRQAQLYALVAGVAVVAGAVGLCCMLLAQVRARRREIGIRLAVGALPADVVLQVMMESLLIAGIGGIVGNAGAALLLVIVAGSSDLPLLFDHVAIMLTAVGTLVAGAMAGATPAMVAARLDPMDSIRT